jgi:hypothetical protein
MVCAAVVEGFCICGYLACGACSCSGLVLASTDSYRVLVMPPYAAEMDCSVTLYDPAGWLYPSRLTFTAFDTELDYDCKCMRSVQPQ